MTVAGTAAARCAAHPARPSTGPCPVCARPRCAVDADGFGAAGCAVCRSAATPERVPASAREVVVRAGLAALAVSYPAGWVAAQYVNVKYMSLAWPLVIGVAASGAAAAAAGPRSRRGDRWVLAVAALGAVLGTALGFRLFGRPVTPLHPLRQVWLPYVAAIAGVGVWPLLFGVPRPGGGRDQPDSGTGL